MDVVSTDLRCRTVEDFSIPVTDGSHKCGAEYSLWPYTTRIPVDKTVATYMYCHIYVTGQNSIQVTIILSWFDSGRCKLQVAGYRKSQLPFFFALSRKCETTKQKSYPIPSTFKWNPDLQPAVYIVRFDSQFPLSSSSSSLIIHNQWISRVKRQRNLILAWI